MVGERCGEEDTKDGLSGEVDLGDFAEDKAEDGFLAEGDEDDLAGAKWEGGGVGECAATLAIDFGRKDLVEHMGIL